MGLHANSPNFMITEVPGFAINRLAPAAARISLPEGGRMSTTKSQQWGRIATFAMPSTNVRSWHFPSGSSECRVLALACVETH